MLSQSPPIKNRSTAVLLALAGAIVPGLHKFYLGQRGWGLIYLLFFWTGIPRIASIVEGIWFLVQGQAAFDQSFNGGPPVRLVTSTPPPPPLRIDPGQVGAIAEALRQLDRLRQEGLISEYEFEQKRRRLLDQIE